MSKPMSTRGLDVTNLTSELRDRLYRFILARVRDPHLAQDLTQETLLRAARSLIHTEVTRLEGWLFRVARNAVADHFRGSRDQVEWHENEHGEAVHQDALSKEELELRDELASYVRSVVEELPEPYRGALLLTEYEGLTQKELAERLGISLSCAKSRVQRARAEVRRTIEHCCRVATDPYGQITELEPRSRPACGC